MFAPLYLVLCVFAVFTLDSTSTQNIYDGNYEACHYNISKNIQEFQNYTRTATHSGYEVYFNLCNNLTGINYCDDDAMVCVKKNSSKFIPNAGRNIFLDDKKDLVALNGRACNKGNNYTTVIKFNTAQKEKETFHLDDCTLTITLNPEPSCSTNVDGFMLDLSPLSRMNNITVKSSSYTYSLGICNYSTVCGDPYSGCNVNTTEKFIDFHTQKVEYDHVHHKLVVKGKQGKKNLKHIFINCNWFVSVGKTEKLVRKYEFGVESKYGCVKLPMNCTALAKGKYFYNISKLYRPMGYHLELPDGKLSLNVCGPLEQQQNTECSDIHSQVCLRSNGKYIGYGSLANPLKTLEDGLELEFLYGSRCREIESQFYTTKIKFVCTLTENEPKFISSINCTNNFLWETPQACSKNIEAEIVDFIEDNIKQEQEVLDCRVGEVFDLNPLVSNEKNYEVRDSDGNLYYINVCRPLVITKETYDCKSNGACFSNATDNDSKTKYIGFGRAKVPEFGDDGLVLAYKGGLCKAGFILYEVVIKFRCSKEAENLITFHNKTDCKFEFFWDTPLVCKRNLLKCHRILNFDKIITSQMLIKTGLLKYNFNLCQSQYSVISLSSGKEDVLNANTSLIYSKCQYTLEYKLTNTTKCNNPQILNTVYLTFACTKSTTDYYEKESVRDCVLYMKFWTSQICNILNDTNDVECLKQVENIENGRRGVNVEQVHRNCTINLTGGDSMNISSLTPVKVISQNNNVYTIASKTSACGDFVCKNDLTVGSIVDVCPSLNIDFPSRHIRMDFIGSICDKDVFKVALTYRCKESQNDEPKVLSEYACNTTIEVPDDSICTLLQHDLPQDGARVHSGLIAGVVVMIIILSAIVGVLIWRYLRRGNYTCIDKSQIYVRDCRV